MNYRWTPGDGPDTALLLRMQSHFDRPHEAMGEDWFMGHDREMYTYLLDSDPDELEASWLEEPLEAIASGTSSFGSLAEWCSWFHYLLPRLVPIALNSGYGELQELLVTDFVTQYPAGVADAPYNGFREDALRTLGMAIMDASKWQHGNIRVGHVLWPAPAVEDIGWGWWRASPDFSSSMFFCIKYLAPQELTGWLESVFAIDDPHWRAQLMVWLVGAYPLLSGSVEQPAELFMEEPCIDWAWSHCLRGSYSGDRQGPAPTVPFLGQSNLAAFRQSLSRSLTEAVFDDWCVSITSVDYLAREAAHLPYMFRRLYL